VSAQVSRLIVGLILLSAGTVGLLVLLVLVSMSDLEFVDRVEAVEMVAGVLVANFVLAALRCLNWRSAFAATPGRL